jgi:hypothetical protein
VVLIVIRLALIAVAGVLITFALNDSDGGQISPFVLPACLTLPLILALASVATGVGLLEMRAWARNLAIGLIVLDMLMGVAAIALAGGGSGAQWGGILGAGVVSIIVLVYLLRPSISERFE